MTTETELLANALKAFQDAYLTSDVRETVAWQAVLALVSEMQARATTQTPEKPE